MPTIVFFLNTLRHKRVHNARTYSSLGTHVHASILQLPVCKKTVHMYIREIQPGRALEILA